jgi:hypothetical protein
LDKWDVEEHKKEDIRTRGDCCFNHIIGLPQKEGMEKPLFDYEKILYDALLDNDDSMCNTYTLKYLISKMVYCEIWRIVESLVLLILVGYRYYLLHCFSLEIS